jgi:hypothetical protein
MMLGSLVPLRGEPQPVHYQQPILPAFLRRALGALFRKH